MNWYPNQRLLAIFKEYVTRRESVDHCQQQELIHAMTNNNLLPV